MQTKAVKILAIYCLLLLTTFSISHASSINAHVKKGKIKTVTIDAKKKSVQKTIKDAPAPDSGTREKSRKYEADKECLVAAIYYEAKNQGYKGKYAVADVTLNRVDDPDYPKSVCAVVREKGQYSWARKKSMSIKVPKDKAGQEDLEQAKKVAAVAPVVRNLVVGKNVLFFHAKYVKPKWAKKMRKVAQIEDHIFYEKRSKRT